MNTNITKAFTTPIGYFRIPNPFELNPRLVEIIARAETQSPSTRRSNIGGWRSNQDLLDWREPEIAMLFGHIMYIPMLATRRGYQLRLMLHSDRQTNRHRSDFSR